MSVRSFWLTDASFRHTHRAQVSPHEFMQAVMAASNKRYIIDR